MKVSVKQTKPNNISNNVKLSIFEKILKNCSYVQTTCLSVIVIDWLFTSAYACRNAYVHVCFCYWHGWSLFKIHVWELIDAF